MLKIISPDARQQIDPTALINLYSHLPQSDDPSAPILVPVSYIGDFRFNHALPNNRRVILVDFMEHFNSIPFGTTLRLGIDPVPPFFSASPEWQALHNWVAQARQDGRIIVEFKRELFPDYQSPIVYPVEWPCLLPAQRIESKEVFDQRTFDLFYAWGYSHALRPAFQAGAFDLMSKGKVNVISAWDHISAKQHEPQPKWICMHTPHTHRIHITELVKIQAMSKCSVSLPGSGVVCFRSTEAPLHTVPVMVDFNRVWSHPWVHHQNCIGNNPTAYDVHQFLSDHRGDLHSLYVAAQETLDRYRTHRYVREYLIPTIQKHL